MEPLMVEFDFIQPLGLYATEKPYWLFTNRPKGAPDIERTNVQTDRVTDIPVHDVRGSEHAFSLDTHGFQHVRHGQQFRAFDDAQRINDEYLSAVQHVIQEHIPYATKVHVYDWRTRQEGLPRHMVSPNEIETRGFMLAPSRLVHTDSTEFSLKKRVRQFFPDEADRLLAGRVQMVNFWRPMYDTVHNYPLMTCDARTINMDRLIAVDQVYTSFIGDVYYAQYDAGYKWHYQSEMTADEGVLFKSWDTAPDASARACIHASASLPPEALPATYEPRKSIECRALVFSDREG